MNGLKEESADKVRKPIETVALLYLAENPVYVFKARNLKELAAEHVLRDVTIANGELKATMEF